MKKLFAALVISIAASAFCYADCPDPTGGQTSGPPCSAAPLAEDPETSASGAVTAEASPAIVNESSVGDVVTGILFELIVW